VWYWRGCMSEARCRFAYSQADAAATHCLLLQFLPSWFYLSVPAHLGSPGQNPKSRKTVEVVVVVVVAVLHSSLSDPSPVGRSVPPPQKLFLKMVHFNAFWRPGFDLSQQTWCALHCFWNVHSLFAANYMWGLVSSDKCKCGMVQTSEWVLTDYAFQRFLKTAADDDVINRLELGTNSYESIRKMNELVSNKIPLPPHYFLLKCHHEVSATACVNSFHTVFK